MKVYIAGPMRKKPKKNRPAFMAAEERLRAQGHEPINPARLRDKGMTQREIAKVLLAKLCDADAIHLLKGWRKSKGGTAERAVAEWIELEVVE